MEKMLNDFCESLDRTINTITPYIIWFAVLYFTAHIIIAFQKGWLVW